MNTGTTPLPLAGIRVLDVGTLIAGPFAATMLGDFGAEIIKVEQPGVGDALRGSASGGPGQRSENWLVEARNKKSVTLNLRVPEDWKEWADKPLYVLRGAGTYPHRYWCREQYDREETFANAELTTDDMLVAATVYLAAGLVLRRCRRAYCPGGRGTRLRFALAARPSRGAAGRECPRKSR